MADANPQPPRFEAALLAPRYWLTWGLLGVLWLIGWLPRPWVMRLGAWVGEQLLWRNDKRRRIALTNLELCFPQHSLAQRQALLRQHFRDHGRGLLDLGLVLMASKKRVARFSTVVGWENIEAHYGPKPLILISWHTTTLDMCFIALLADIAAVGMMKREPNPVLNWVLYRARTRRGNLTLYLREQGLRGMVRGLKSGRIGYFIADEDFGLGRQSVFAPFFGQPRCTLNIIGRLAANTGAVVLPVICRLNAPTGRYTVEVGPPIADFPTGDETHDATAINYTMERMLLPAPAQYLWTFRWFHTRPPGVANPYRDAGGRGMSILVIKQTSLGDVLHASGHIRAIKQQFPHSRLVLLTAASSAAIYRDNPWVDEIITIDRDRIKANGYRNPGVVLKEMVSVMSALRATVFDLAFDLQGLAKSVVFLYGARARRKFVKGNWPGIVGYRNKHDHALDEMNRVLELAGIATDNTAMQLARGDAEGAEVERLLASLNPAGYPLVVMSPFSRWPSKDWPLARYLQLCGALEQQMARKVVIVLTGAEAERQRLEDGLAACRLNATCNLAGRLSLPLFVELLTRVRVLVTGDSFPMHAATALRTPVVALFGPTHESRVGPRDGEYDIIRAPDCRICDRKNCQQACLARIPVAEVQNRLRRFLPELEPSRFRR